VKRQVFNEIQCVLGLILLAFVISATGCTVQLIAPYDQKIDDGVTNLQKTTSEFLTKIERQNGSKTDDYKNHVNFYDNTKVVLSGIKVRASAIATNSQTIGQLDNLQKLFNNLEEFHKTTGISVVVAIEQQSTFDQAFRAILTLEEAKKGLK